MAQIVTNAIVVRRADYRDNDRMVTLFSPSLGRVDALCRGCRRQKSPLMAASELFCSGEYVLYQSRERTTIVSCAVSDTFYSLRTDFERLAHGMYALELCAAAVQPGQENERLFLLLLRSLAHLCYSDTPPRRVTAVFLMGMTPGGGFRPRVGRGARCARPIETEGEAGVPVAAFSGEAGGLLCVSCGVGERCRVDAGGVRYLQGIMKKGLDSLGGDAECPDELFDALREMAEGRLDISIRSGKLL